ncbi:DinB family protein [Mucilaginibacter sp. RS28]|uniref:DinB family protein n=1 Tax=Mucilaginibacter straminoryzae TaxID=2932774 RepID=A0A9X2BC02_9SPHI|nr:DinB family protein [Mucilaginibacter straminoryzae]MCJ8208803.1 DinB family protein [Mucilaginibacter straminoryzae]
MATTAEILERKFDNVFHGQPWYGRNIFDIISDVTFETAYEKPAGAAHTILEILLHMLSWTQEVTARLGGKFAGTPEGDDWPKAGKPDEARLPQVINDLKLANVNLVKAIHELPDEKWQQLINDERDEEPVATYEGLVDGFIQHQVYHAGQIAILNRMLGGR